ncbi:hypothetical protein G9F72_025765 [Clostridium estertheticum]|uniref:hypothetical protein n=1 Tax=Clostridium estertheticum TaxID=238834 RepID=UPI0013E92C51|nr:hypothetical protein [Clostridium estertheticum]MBZ9689689.1 hypothetical protein [Clostridium estertheticum]
MKKREIFMLSALTFSMGIVFGFLLSPVKQGIGNNSGNSLNNYYDKKQSIGDESKRNSSIESMSSLNLK